MLPNLDLSRLDQPQLEPNRKAFNHTQSTSPGVFIVMTVFSGCVPRGRLGKERQKRKNVDKYTHKTQFSVINLGLTMSYKLIKVRENNS